MSEAKSLRLNLPNSSRSSKRAWRPCRRHGRALRLFVLEKRFVWIYYCFRERRIWLYDLGFVLLWSHDGSCVRTYVRSGPSMATRCIFSACYVLLADPVLRVQEETLVSLDKLCMQLSLTHCWRHYFLFDLCYYAQILCLVYLWLAPANSTLWVAAYLLSHGKFSLSPMSQFGLIGLNRLTRQRRDHLAQQPRVPRSWQSHILVYPHIPTLCVYGHPVRNAQSIIFSS